MLCSVCDRIDMLCPVYVRGHILCHVYVLDNVDFQCDRPALLYPIISHYECMQNVTLLLVVCVCW